MASSAQEEEPVGLPLFQVVRPCGWQQMADDEESSLSVNASHLEPADWPAGATTAMLRNIANRCTQEELMRDMNSAGLEGQYDFFYLPIDFKTKRNLGYAFVNFTSVDATRCFFRRFDNQHFERHKTQKVLKVSPALVQGFEANIGKLQKQRKRVHNPWFCATVLDGTPGTLP